MPSIECRSSIRAASENCSLVLDVRHHLVAGEPSDSIHIPDKTKFPQNVDVLLTSNLIIKLSGAVDGLEASDREIYTSALAQHLVDYLYLNATKLGLNTLSKLCNGEDGSTQLVLTPSRQPPANFKLFPTHISLVAIDLRYSWKTSELGELGQPFALRLSRSNKSLLDNVVGRFAKWQLVNRYPLIFGPWCQQLDRESSYFSTIGSSILRIMNRSHNAAFRAQSQCLMKILHRRRLAVFSHASISLATYLGVKTDEDDVNGHQTQDATDEDAIKFALEKVYRDGLPRHLFKGLFDLSGGCNTTSGKTQILSPDKRVDHEDVFWDDTSMDFPTVTYSPSPSNHSSFMDIQSDSDREYFSDIIDDCDIDELPPWEYHDNIEKHHFEPRHTTTDMLVPSNSLDGIDDNGILPIMVHSDAEDHLTIESEKFDCKLGLSRPFLCNDRSSCEMGSTEQSSQDAVIDLLELDKTSQAVKGSSSLPLHLPRISEQPPDRNVVGTNIYASHDGFQPHQPFVLDISHDKDRLYRFHEASPPPVIGAPIDGDDDLDLETEEGIDFLAQMETKLKSGRDLTGKGGVSVAMSTRPSFSETSYSHHSPTLGVTCPSQSNCDCQLRAFQEFEDSEEELCRDVDGDSTCLDNFEEEDLSVLDF